MSNLIPFNRLYGYFCDIDYAFFMSYHVYDIAFISIRMKSVLKSLSRSTKVIFVFDLFVLFGTTTLLLNYVMNVSCNSGIKFSAIALISIVGLFSLFLKSNYRIQNFEVTFGNIFKLFEAVIFAHIPAIILLFFFISKAALLKFSLINITLVFICLLLYRLGFHYFLFNFKKIKKVLIIGANDRAKVIAEIIKNKPALRMEVVGIVKSAEAEKIISELNSQTFKYNLTETDCKKYSEKIKEEKNFCIDEPVTVYENGKDIHNIVLNTNTDVVIFTDKSCLVNALPEKVDFHLMTDFYEMATGKFYVDEATLETYIYDVWKKNHPNCYNEPTLYDFCKRIMDIISALIILVVTLPITGFTALRIWLTDHENPIYTQDRVGKNGKIFKCYKLRTMWANNFIPKDKKKVGYVENQEEDDRVIPWCKFVRKARFDEIPQMINILRGDMSIVGPRCEWKEVADVYKDEVLGYKYRMLVNTAWTGWAQINQGHCVSVHDITEKLQYDLYYIKHRNIFWDISILVKAVFLALGGRHA